MKVVEPALVAAHESSELLEPYDAALNHTPIAAKFLTCLSATSGNAGRDFAVQGRLATTPAIIGVVGVQFVRPPSGATALACDERNGVEQVFEWHTVVDVVPVRRKASGMPHRSVIRWRLVPRRGAHCFPAATDEPSMQARLQSMRPASRSRRSKSTCSRSYTPVACQSRNRLQHVTPELQFISAGSHSHGMPVRSTSRFPAQHRPRRITRSTSFGNRRRQRPLCNEPR